MSLSVICSERLVLTFGIGKNESIESLSWARFCFVLFTSVCWIVEKFNSGFNVEDGPEELIVCCPCCSKFSLCGK